MQNRVALVTGGTGGIGSAISRRLAEDGYKVAAAYFPGSKAKAEEWLKKIHAEGMKNVAVVPGDVTDFASCKAMVEETAKLLGPVDILVNNAGITKDTTFKKMTLEQWNDVLRTNLDSLFNVTKHVTDGMTERGFGRIINISSVNGQKGQFGQVNYSAAKAGIYGFTKALAQEVVRKGVTVNSISPGYIATEMVMAIPEDVRKKIVDQIPVGRLGKPEEIAAVVSFLASDHAAFITGANIAANGGQHMF